LNTTPWIALSLCEKTGLLNDLYEEVFIPSAVREEILAGGKTQIGVQELKQAIWLRIEEIQDPSKVLLLHELDQGEAEVILLAQEKKVTEVILDERLARMQARIAGVQVVGTLGLLLRGKKTGIVRKVRPMIEKILQGGVHIHQNIVEAVLREAGE